jgi:hypothetical protein
LLLRALASVAERFYLRGSPAVRLDLDHELDVRSNESVRMLRRLVMGRRTFVVTTALGLAGFLTAGIVAATLAQGAAELPGPDPVFDDSDPPWQLHAEAGQVIGVSAAEDAALRAGGDPGAVVTSTELLPYEAARTSVGSGNNLSLGPDRQVYLVTLTGSFTFRRHPAGVPDRNAGAIYVIVDALTGEVMSKGELPRN